MEDPRADGELEFHFVKSTAFKVLHVDGVLGGPSPSGRMLHMAVYSERSPMPTKVVHTISKGVLGSEIGERRESKQGVFREIEADLVMPLEVAVSLRTWLDEQISALSQMNESLAALSEEQK